jgi:hypothetical protein
MPDTRLGPNSHIRVTNMVPRSGRVEYIVDADHPVETLVLNDAGLAEFNDGNETIYSSYGGFSDRKHHQQRLELPFKGTWHFLIVNNDDRSVDVNYEVRP